MAGNNLAWGLPIFARAVWGREKFTPGAFYTGKRFSLPIAWAAIAFLVFGIILAMFPDGGPDPTPQTMNCMYSSVLHLLLLPSILPELWISLHNTDGSLDTVVVNMAVWGGCTVYYFVDARKWFTGPKTTVEEIDEVVGQEVATENNGILGDAKVAEAEGSGPETDKKQ